MDEDVEVDPATGLRTELLAYAPDTRPYDLLADRDRPPAWLDELDLRPGPPHVRLGTHGTTLDRWLLPDAARSAELALRARLLAERTDEVVGIAPGEDTAVEAAGAELLAAVLAWLVAAGVDHADPSPGEHPLVAAARLVQEDLCLLVRHDDGWHLAGGVLAFPSLWRLHDRLGRPLLGVHAPVPGYDSVGERVDRFLDRLRPDRVVWRRNVLLKPFPHLHTPQADLASLAPTPVDADGAPYWIRSERQSFRLLPDSGAIVFAIRTQIARAEVLLGRPDVAAALVDHVRSWDAPLRAYRSADVGRFPSFLAWLESVAAVGG